MLGIRQVAFNDEAGNPLAVVEWTGENWSSVCEADDLCEWRWVDDMLDSAVAITAGHLGLHKLAGVTA